MALKVLMLRKRLNDKQAELRTLEETASAFATREAELETAVEEAQTEEERSVVEAEIEQFETTRAQNEQEQETVRAAIAAMEAEIRTAEEAAKEARRAKDAGKGEERKDDTAMNTRTKFFGMTTQERDAFFARQEVKDFLSRARELKAQQRTVSGAELLVPTVVLDLVREQIPNYSKLIKHVNAKAVPGKARQGVMGTVPEGIWTEAVGKLNELGLSFSNVEVDAFKVGGYFAVPNATLEDSDIALATELMNALAQSIGLAVDKAILYGTGKKMPLGIVTRLAQTEQPSDYPATARAWKDLHESNVKSISAANSTGTKLFQNLLKEVSAAKGSYSRNVKFWAMNESTKSVLQAEALSFNAAGALVAGIDNAMPVIGGTIETLSFIPDNVIIGGYGDLYLLAERSGTVLAQSEHALFLDDQTAFKGTARYDGLPVIAEGFVAIGINAATVSAGAVTFTADAANAG